MKSIDELLPEGPINAKKARTLHSDHEPRVSQTTVTDSQGGSKEVTLLTYNTLSVFGAGGPGFEFPQQPEDWDPQRQVNIVNRIANIATKRSCNLICLQETSNEFRDKVLLQLNGAVQPPEWACLASEGDNDPIRGNRVVFYKTSDFTPHPDIKKSLEGVFESKSKGIKSFHFCGGQLTVKGLTDKTIHVFSGHIPHSENVEELEEVLTQISKQDETVLLGCDTNRRVANLGWELHDNANNIIPPVFRGKDDAGCTYDSTDVCFHIEKDTVRQLPGVTPSVEDAAQDLLRKPRLDLSLDDNPFKTVPGPNRHQVPVGPNGMNSQQFAQRLLVTQDAVKTQLDVRLRTNQKALTVFSNSRIAALDDLGLAWEGEEGKDRYYTLYFNYDKKPENENIFFVNVGGITGVTKRCSLDGSHKAFDRAEAIKKDLGIFMGVEFGATGLGAGIGAVLGTFAFPLVGTAAGAAIGAAIGAAAGCIIEGWQGLIRSSMLGGQNPMRERIGAGILSTLSSVGTGALLGTFVFPGIGTLIGGAIGAGFGVLSSVIIGAATHPRSRLSPVVDNANKDNVVPPVPGDNDAQQGNNKAVVDNKPDNNEAVADNAPPPVPVGNAVIHRNPFHHPQLQRSQSAPLPSSHDESVKAAPPAPAPDGSKEHVQEEPRRRPTLPG